jgi:urease gamma subunit
MRFGATIPTRDNAIEVIAEVTHEIKIEATSPDGTKLITVHKSDNTSGSP